MDENNSLNWTENDWAAWLEQKLTDRQKSYEYIPEDLTGSYNREVSHTKDYHGREILELIQNADDAGLGFPKKSKLKIILSNNTFDIF